jgi:Amt family ammonium transporter
MLVPSAPYLSAGDTAWQLTAATLVGLMTVPGMAMLYGGLMPRRLAVNSAFMVLYAFAAVLVVWLLAGYAIGFGSPLRLGPGMLSALVGVPRPVLGALAEIGRARVPLLTGAMPAFRLPNAALVYFQFAFAAITPALLAGAVLGRMGLRAWMLFVPLWSLAVYSVNAFWLWGGGWLSQLGAVDYSGGYVIHVAAGVSGFVAAAAVGARRGGRHAVEAPNNLLLALLGAGILWLGWNGFNGGDPYFANQDAAAAVLNTNLGAAAAMLTWVGLDAWTAGRPTLAGAINGLVAGLVAITPAAGYVNGYGALIVGAAAGLVPWLTMNRLGRLPLLRRVDDTLGVLHTHGVAGAVGGLLTGLLADPAMIVYDAVRGAAPVAVAGLFYGDPERLLAQAVGLVAIVAYDALMTLAVLKVVSLAVPLRMSEGEEELGDALLHGEHAQAPEHDHAALRRAVEAALRGHGVRAEAEAASEG